MDLCSKTASQSPSINVDYQLKDVEMHPNPSYVSTTHITRNNEDM